MRNQSATLVELAPQGKLEDYERDGFAFLPSLFTPEEVATLRAAIPAALSEHTERTVYEYGTRTVRSVFAIHQHHRVFTDLAMHPRLLGPVRALVGSDVYVYQSKLNSKAVFGGDVWPWHQDYIFWRNEDGMPAPRVLTAAVFLDEVTEINGPITVIPGSHHGGIVEHYTYDGTPEGYEDRPPWIANLVAKLKYTVTKEAFVRLAGARGVVAPKGPEGSVLFFHGNAAHASAANLSPFERNIALFTYNAIDNAPPAEALHRPEFLVSRDTAAAVAVADTALLT